MADSAEMKRVLRLLRDAETYLIELLARAVERGNTGSEAVYLRQQRALQDAIMAARRYLQAVERQVTPAVLAELERAYMQGAGTGVTTVHPEAIAVLAVDVQRSVQDHLRSVLRTTEDQYRQIMRSTVASHLTAGADWRTSAQVALNRFADRGIAGFTDSANRRWGIDTYVDMALRTGRRRALSEGRLQRWREQGARFIIVSSHADPAPQCEPYQGRVLSIDGTPAGQHAVMVGDREETVTVTATLQDAIDNGYQHVNCRHTETVYYPGMSAPEPPPVKRGAYAATQRQRAMERHVRKWKKREAAALTPGEKSYARTRVRQWQAELRRHVGAHAHLSRDSAREQIRAGIKTATAPSRTLPAGVQ